MFQTLQKQAHRQGPYKTHSIATTAIVIMTLLNCSLIQPTESIRLSDDWVRLLKITNTNDPTVSGKIVVKFSNNIMVLMGCNVYECSYFKNGYTFHLQNQGLCNQKTQLYCEDPTIDRFYLDLFDQAAEIREDNGQVRLLDRNEKQLMELEAI